MIILMLSFFDAKLGPNILFTSENIPEHLRLEHVPLLMDFYEEGFFLHEFGELKTANLIFQTLNKHARGGRETFIISVLLFDENVNLYPFQDLLRIFKEGFERLEHVEDGFQFKRDADLYKSKQYLATNEYFTQFYNTLPQERAVFKLRETRIFIYGLPQAGVTTIISDLNENFFNNALMEAEISVAKKLLGNLSIMSYQFTSSDTINEVLNAFLKDIDGLIFVMDASDTSQFDEAREELHRITNFPSTYGFPLLILLNKIEKATREEEEIIKKLRLNLLKHANVIYYSINALDNKGISQAFNWLAREIMNQLLRDPSHIL